MVEPVRHRQTKEAATDMFEPKATAPHLDSTATKFYQVKRPPFGGRFHARKGAPHGWQSSDVESVLEEGGRGEDPGLYPEHR